jgi:hypothetical protein
MTSILNERVGSVCKRLGIELELDAKGNPSLVTLALIGVRFLPSQPEFQPRRRGRGRPKGTVRRSREDMAAIKFIEEYAVLRPDIKFEKLVGRAATFLERKGCTDWLERGLSPPQMVTTTAAYLESEDAVAAWIEDCAARDPNAFARKPTCLPHGPSGPENPASMSAARSDFPKTSKPGDLHRIATGNSAVDLTGSDFRAPIIDKRTFEKASKMRGVTHVTVILLIDATRARGGIIPKTCQICHGVYFGHFRLREIPKGVPFQFNSDNVDMGGVVV